MKITNHAKGYTINPSEWEQQDATTWVYTDDNLQMRVTLERETVPANSLPWKKILYNGWVLKADSLTYADENNVYFYDALSREFSNPPVLTRAHSDLFFDNPEQDEPNPVLLPDWLIEHMEYLQDQDAQADANLYQWAQELNGATFDDYEEMHRNARNWYASHYINGG